MGRKSRNEQSWWVGEGNRIIKPVEKKVALTGLLKIPEGKRSSYDDC
jgi:hypothetical protein